VKNRAPHEITKPCRERKKQLLADLAIIGITAVLALAAFGAVNMFLPGLENRKDINIALRVFIIGFFAEFGLAGMGLCIVCLIRKEPFGKFGLNSNRLLPCLFLSLLCCVPECLFYLFSTEVYGWFPFIGVKLSYEALHTAFPSGLLAYLQIALFWGFFEGFNYVVVFDKLDELFPSRYAYLNKAAFIIAVFCILIHGAVGVTPSEITEMLCTMFLIYGMLIVRKQTGNGWGCVFIFFVYWNAINRFHPILF